MFIHVYSTLWLNEVQQCSILARILKPLIPRRTQKNSTAGHIKICLKPRLDPTFLDTTAVWGSWLPKWVDLGRNLSISSFSQKNFQTSGLWHSMIKVCGYVFLTLCFFPGFIHRPNSNKPRGALWRSCRGHCFAMNSQQMTRYLIPISIQMDTIAYVIKWNRHQLEVTTSWKKRWDFPHHTVDRPKFGKAANIRLQCCLAIPTIYLKLSYLVISTSTSLTKKHI